MVTKLVGVKEFRQNLARYYGQAKKHGWRYIVLSRNKPIFKVEPLTDREATLEKLAADIAHARQQVKEGKVYSVEEVSKHLGL